MFNVGVTTSSGFLMRPVFSCVGISPYQDGKVMVVCFAMGLGDRSNSLTLSNESLNDGFLK